jgi:hypothetical protein
MAFLFRTHPPADLMVGWGWGRITASEIVDAARALPGLPGYRARLDRLTIIHPEAQLSEMAPEALRDVREALRGYDRLPAVDSREEPGRRYRSALVSSNVMAGFVLKLYGAYGNAEASPTGEFQVFETPEDALRWLGRDGLALPPAPYEAPDVVASPHAVGQDRS